MRQTTDLLFISKVIYEHGEPWWNDDFDKKLPILPKALYDYPTTELSASKQEERTKGMMNLALKITFIHACN
jgi:hypothetical protein